MTTSHLLQVRRAEREALLGRLKDQLHNDEHVAAAWLAGPGVEGVADDLSGVDLWLAVADAQSQAIIAQRRDYVARVARPLLVEESLTGAPQEGACLLVLYPGQGGPHQVRWHWLPQARARLPRGACLLVDRAAIPVAAASDPLTRRQRAQVAGQRTMRFWAMVHSAAQCIARHEPWAALSLMGQAREALEEVRSLVGSGPASEPVDASLLPAPSPRRQLAVLRALAQAMERLTPQVGLLGARVPVQAILQIHCFLDLAEELVAEGSESALVEQGVER
jgi:hypothetical protein